MGALLQILARALQFGGPAAIGYWFNDLGTATAKAFGVSKEPDGRPPTWVVIVVALLAGAALYLVVYLVQSFIPKSKRTT